jgi:hypothetical protein
MEMVARRSFATNAYRSFPPDEIVHVTKLFNPSLDRSGEAFANLATRTGLNDLRWFRHQPLVGQTNCQSRRRHESVVGRRHVEHRCRSLAAERVVPDRTIL